MSGAIIDAAPPGTVMTPEAIAHSQQAVKDLALAAVPIAKEHGDGAVVDALITLAVQIMLLSVGQADAVDRLKRVAERIPELALSMQPAEGSA